MTLGVRLSESYQSYPHFCTRRDDGVSAGRSRYRRSRPRAAKPARPRIASASPRDASHRPRRRPRRRASRTSASDDSGNPSSSSASSTAWWPPGWDTPAVTPPRPPTTACATATGTPRQSASPSTPPSSRTSNSSFTSGTCREAERSSAGQRRSTSPRCGSSTKSQRAAVDASIAQLCSSSIGDDTEVVTEVLEFQSWADAEERHQNYMRKHRAAKAERAADAQQWVNAWGGREGGR